MRKLLLTLALTLAAAGVQAVPLSDLFNGGSIIAGDKLFNNWTFDPLTGFRSSDGRTFNAANIDVTALSDGGLNPGPGLRFTVSNNELSVTGDGIYAFVDLMFGFRVSVLDPRYKITDNSLRLTGGAVTNSGDNGLFIHEDIGTAPGGSDLGTKSVEFSWLDGTGLISNLADSATFSPQTGIWVTKNILVWATGVNETASLQGFEQRFSQIPEPATLALAGLALAGLAVMRRRKLA